MRTVECKHCGSEFVMSADRCIVEVDERSLDEMRVLLTSEFGSLECEHCHAPTPYVPTVVIWTNRRAHVELVEGGPWSDDNRAVDMYPQLAASGVTSHVAIAELLAKIDSRYIEWLETFRAAAEQLGSDDGAAWFREHYERLGAEIYVAVQLGSEGLLSASIANASDDAGALATDQILGLIQAQACLAMCGRWGDFRFEGQRLQDCMDTIVFPNAVSAAAPERFGAAVEALISNGVSQPLGTALEATHAWLCACASIENARAESYTHAMFKLEVYATAAGGSLPVLAHVCRLDSDRLKSTLDPRTLKSAILDARGPATADLIETARRVGHPEAAEGLITTPTPDWLKKLRTPGVLGHIIMQDPAGESLHTGELTAANVLSPSKWFLDRREGVDAAESGPYDVFISYSARDRLRADAITRYLHTFGLSVFMDHHTAGGDLWTRNISSHLYSSRLVLVLWSRDSLHSEWVMKEAETALKRGVLTQALLAPVAVPKRFAHIQATRLEGWALQPSGPELQRLVSDLCHKLGREIPAAVSSPSDDVLEQYHRLDVAEAVFDLCNAAAWHSVATPTEETLAPVGTAYSRLKAALEPVDDKVLHEFLDRFDLVRVCLLAAVVSLAKHGLDALFPTHPRVSVIRTKHSVTMNCEATQVWRSQFMDALREATGATKVSGERLAAAAADVLALPDGVMVEVYPHPRNERAVGSVTIRASRT